MRVGSSRLLILRSPTNDYRLDAEPDGDGVENWQEYALALVPMSSDAGLAWSVTSRGLLDSSYRKNRWAPR
jgi:hypothetical protein